MKKTSFILIGFLLFFAASGSAGLLDTVKQGAGIPQQKSSDDSTIASGLKEAKGEYRFVMEANLRYVFACLYARNGVCGGLAANLRIWDIQLHWIGVGVMYYGGYGDDRALSVPEFGRKLDLMLTSGLDWRIWNGLEIRAQVAWFIPPPGPIYDKAKERIERAVDEVSVENPIPDKKAPKEAWDIVVDAYERAFRSPYLVIGVRWEF